jgi:hypothetical protein
MADYIKKFQKKPPAPVVISTKKQIVSTIDKKIIERVEIIEQAMAVEPTPTPTPTPSGDAFAVFEYWGHFEYSAISELAIAFDTVTPQQMLEQTVDFTDSWFIPLAYVAPPIFTASEVTSNVARVLFTTSEVTSSLRRATRQSTAANNIYGLNEQTQIDIIALGQRMHQNPLLTPSADDGIHVSLWREASPGVFEKDTGAVFSFTVLEYTPNLEHAGTLTPRQFESDQVNGTIRIWEADKIGNIPVYDVIVSFTLELTAVDGNGNPIIVAPIVYTQPAGYSV